MALANRRSVMTLYSDERGLESHAIRLVLAEKGISNLDIISVDADNKPEELTELNPYHTILTLVDRDLVLYDAQVIMEYLDERFPHPPLMPVDPVWRANNRMCRQRIGRELYSQIDALDHGGDKKVAAAKKRLREALCSLAPVFEQKTFFMSEDLTLMDCYIAPLLWRLPYYHINLPCEAESVSDYAQRLFTREAFQASLSPIERDMRL